MDLNLLHLYEQTLLDVPDSPHFDSCGEFLLLRGNIVFFLSRNGFLEKNRRAGEIAEKSRRNEMPASQRTTSATNAFTYIDARKGLRVRGGESPSECLLFCVACLFHSLISGVEVYREGIKQSTRRLFAFGPKSNAINSHLLVRLKISPSLTFSDSI